MIDVTPQCTHPTLPRLLFFLQHLISWNLPSVRTLAIMIFSLITSKNGCSNILKSTLVSQNSEGDKVNHTYNEHFISNGEACGDYISACTIYREYLNINETVIWFWIVSSECAKHLRLTLAGLTSPSEGRWVPLCVWEGGKGKGGNPSPYALQLRLKESSLLKRPHRRGASKLQLFLLCTTDISLDLFLSSAQSSS